LSSSTSSCKSFNYNNISHQNNKINQFLINVKGEEKQKKITNEYLNVDEELISSSFSLLNMSSSEKNLKHKITKMEEKNKSIKNPKQQENKNIRKILKKHEDFISLLVNQFNSQKEYFSSSPSSLFSTTTESNNNNNNLYSSHTLNNNNILQNITTQHQNEQ
jgi:vacuolar-type H+-ATPase subunit I/STV1